MANNEMFIPFLSTWAENLKTKSEFKKASHLLESKLEDIVRSHQKPTKYRTVLNFIYVIISFATQFVSFVALLFTVLESSKTDAMPFYVLIKVVLMVAFQCVFLSQRTIEKYEYRRHFSDIGEITKIAYLAFPIVFTIHTIAAFSYGVTGLDICVFVGFSYSFIFIVVSVLVASQEATKLRFDPSGWNHLYTLLSSMSKDKGSVRIVESSVFKITLQNIGSEIWNSNAFILHRHTGTCHKGDCVKFNLPQFTLLPQQKIDLIPEGLKYEGDCIRVPNFHCFGWSDRADHVKTFITDKEEFCCRATEGEGMKSCTCYKERIAELVVTYNKNLWTNVIVS